MGDLASHADRPGARPAAASLTASDTLQIVLSGQVQGVGFRPFVYRLAQLHGVRGQVQNRLGDVHIVACGTPGALREFQHDLVAAAPPLSRPRIDSVLPVTAGPFDHFAIAASSSQAKARVCVPPDYFLCDDCRREQNDPQDRRYRYPFINCTQCGPRYTLIEALPYDRPNTSMASFPLCPACMEEYLDPADRRFHAEPVACAACGPRLSFVRSSGTGAAETDAALVAAVAALRDGEVIAVKGIGGYHLLCDARNADAVSVLRRRKRRPDKPLAVMFPVEGRDGLASVRRYATLGEGQADLVRGPVRPIVLACKKTGTDLAENIAPDLPELGVFLPYSPLHQLLLADFGGPLIATSGNLSGEPVLTDNDEASDRLAGIADAFLHHNRPIVRPADDPVYREIRGAMRPIRLGRGVAPVELRLPWRQQRPVLAVGGHLKNTIALSWDDRVVVSPHIGEMDSPRSLRVFEQVAEALQNLYGVQAEALACDAHPGYTTHRWAASQAQLPVTRVWHHDAHASALAAEAEIANRCLVFTWDGVGLGADGTLWGGEGLLGSPGAWQRVTSLRPFRLPGGDRAGREPWRSAAALHWECGLAWPDCPDRDGLLQQAWQRNLNCPHTSAAGRLFDAAAALVCGTMRVSHEAQGPMRLEALCRAPGEPVGLPMVAGADDVLRADWAPLLPLLADASRSAASRAEAFHTSMALLILEQARRIRERERVTEIGLCGGVFQNRVLTEQAVERLTGDGFRVYLSRQLPCNDAALSYGQAAEIAARHAAGTG